MATLIEQQPLYVRMPVGQKIIYTASNSAIVAAEQRVKFVARVYITSGLPPVINSFPWSDQPIGTFKTIPNNKGVGIFDFSDLISNYVSADNLCTDLSTYKERGQEGFKTFPIHVIDRFSMNTNSCIYAVIIFSIEYLDTNQYIPSAPTLLNPNYNTIVNVQGVKSRELEIFNGYSKHTDLLQAGVQLINNSGLNYGYYFDNLELGSSTSKFLSNAPTTQWARSGDYGTLSYSNKFDANIGIDYVSYVKFEYYPELDAGGGVLAFNDQFDRTSGTGAYDIYNAETQQMVIFFGAFPGNLRVYGTNFRTYLNAGDVKSYTIQTFDSTDKATSEKITININCKNLKGYEQRRLTWLNQYGTWDYYTFNQKSVATISTKGTTYSQSGGTWNESEFRIDAYKGGKKSFRVNATETIKMNSDYLSEEHSGWFEELINSPEVYMLKRADQPTVVTQLQVKLDTLTRFVIPVRLKTSSFTKKTVANDKLIQYTIEVEKSRTLRTQSV